ncbi:MAG: hypothetical protein U0871_10620 [Gemmataceae bacterium]
MVRIKVCSGLAGLALASGLAAQEPPMAFDKPSEPTRGEVVVFKYPGADGADAAVTAALANHPDVKLAEAKVRVAEAELAQAKLLVAQRVAAASARVAQAKAKVATATSGFNRLKKLQQQKVVSTEEVAGAEQTLLAAKADLAAAEAELKAAQGVAPGTAVVWFDKSKTLTEPLHRPALGTDSFVERFNGTAVSPPSPAGSPADKLRGLLDKEVTLDQKKLPLDEALAAFQKSAGLTDLTIRYPEWASAKELKAPPTVGPLTGKRTAAGWFQLILDDFNRTLRQAVLPPGKEYVGTYDLYVRDYGLLMTKTDLAPAGALTLTQLTHLPRLTAPAPASGPSHDVRVKLAELLAKTVKLPEQKEKPLRDLVTGLMKGAGSDLEVTSALYTDPGLTLPAGERTVAAWLALMLDLRNGTNSPSERVVIYVREYGLLLGQTNNPPTGGVPLGEIVNEKQR